MLGPIDVAVFRWINETWVSPLADTVFRFLSLATKWNSVRLFLLVLFLAMVARGGRARTTAILTMLAWPIANALSDVFKNMFPTLRPCVELPNVRLVSDYWGGVHFLDSYGTMSAHSANMAAVACVTMLMMRSWGLPWLVIAFLTGLSRIYMGVHYPSQVILGWLGGAFCGWVVVKSYHAFIELKQRKEAAA